MFSVIIPTKERNDLLVQCLDRLGPSAQELPMEQYEVIIADDGRASTARQLINERYPWARWIAGPGRGPAANRNAGAERASGEWLVFTDDDCVPCHGWISSYLTSITAHEACRVFEGRTYVDRPRRSLKETAPVNEQGGCLWSCNFAIRKDLFRQMGGFNENFPHPAMEDVEFAHRLRRHNEEIRFVRSAAVCHPWRQLGGWKEQRRHQESTLFYLSLHPEERGRINSGFYFRSVARSLLFEVFPAVFSMKLRGLGSALIGNGGSLLMAVRLAWLRITL